LGAHIRPPEEELSVVNQKDSKRFKKMLEERRQRAFLSGRKTLAEEATVDTDDLPDEIDQASSEYQQGLTLRLRDREKYLIQKIDHALTRIEDGTFGICEECSEPISVKRLEVRPETTLCIRCKEEQEKEERSYT
jgi:DnaK suppressor protein